MATPPATIRTFIRFKPPKVEACNYIIENEESGKSGPRHIVRFSDTLGQSFAFHRVIDVTASQEAVFLSVLCFFFGKFATQQSACFVA